MPKASVIRETEAQFQRAILDLARVYGWRCYHQRPGLTLNGVWRSTMMGHAGWPDLVLCRAPRLIIAEVKTETGKLSDDQWLWIQQLEWVPGIEVYVWRPSAFETIKTLLQR